MQMPERTCKISKMQKEENTRMKTNSIIKNCLVLTATLSLCSCAKTLSDPIPPSAQRNNSAEGYLDVNEDNPGEEINIKSSIVYGKYTIIDFTSPGCGPCQQVKPMLKQMHDFRPDIVVRSFDINRKGAGGIEWDSPLAHQYGIHSVPSFIIFNEKGVQIADGGAASDQVYGVINKDMR